MKKLFLVLLVLFFASPSFSAEVDSILNQRAMQKRINEVGFKLLNSNRIPYRVIFYYKPATKKVVNACSLYSDKKVYVYEGIIAYLDSDDELAAILGHEISHSVDYNQGLLKGYFSYLPMALTPRKYEYKADKRAVDFMVNAGYNPVAMIVMANKIMSQPRYDWYASHPLTSRRLMAVYEYIYNKYPYFLANNQYKDNIYYQNFLLTSQENRKQLQGKIVSQNKDKLHYN